MNNNHPKEDISIHRPEKRPTLKEAQTLVGGYVEMVTLNDGSQLLVNEEGLLRQLSLNEEATRLWGSQVFGHLCGPVVHLTGKAIWTDDE
jgi:hypothetical protein